MPYQLQSALGAGLADAAGFMAGQTERKRYLAEQQRQANLDANAQADTQARLGIERSNQEATNAYRKSTLDQAAARMKIEADRDARADADAAAAAQKQKLIDAFQSQGLHYPKNWDKMKPEEKIGYLQVRLNAAQKAGDSKTVSNTETEINRVATQAEADRRQALADKKADAPAKPTYADLHPRPRAGRTPSAQEVYFEQHGYSPPTYSEANPQTKPQSPNQTNSFTANRVMLWSSQNPGATDDQIRAAFPNVNKSIMDTVLGTGSVPAAPGGGATKKTVSLKAAMALPNNKGKTAQQVQADITAHGYAVAP